MKYKKTNDEASKQNQSIKITRKTNKTKFNTKNKTKKIYSILKKKKFDFFESFQTEKKKNKSLIVLGFHQLSTLPHP